VFGPDDIAALRRTLHGQVISPEDPGYEEARQVYNAMIQRRPGLIARCQDAEDVVAALRLGVARDAQIAVRGGGHNAGGLGVCDEGLVIDLSRMKGIRVDAEARTARVEGGALWRDVDAATHAYGMAVPSGVVSSTGVGGLTLGGGTGYLSRRYGLTIDNLRAAEVVLADGQKVRASEDEHEDLFWALRGGGGNFGVVTAFEFRLQPVDQVVAGPMFWPLARAREVMTWYRGFLLQAPEELYGFLALMHVPPNPHFPPELHGTKVCAIIWCWSGPAGRADEVLQPVRAMKPVLDGVQPMPFPALQSAFDPLLPAGMQWYWRGAFIEDIPDAAIDQHLAYTEKLPSLLSTLHMYPMDRAPQRVGRNDTAFSYREANWNMVHSGIDPDPAKREKLTAWARAYADALNPYTLGGGYVNFLMGDEAGNRMRATYRDNYPRLVEVKRRYDPENHFRVNHNISPQARPAAGAEAGSPPEA
jgi:FAD/FMN-containing dehydrogenase